ncbi:hypothetical protein [Sediminibacterium sp. TEGAF015]|uniref:hypothetical protein n=1 Tax=Sediminibacterium sp. TEGAF015 TaxID=575378 RepID=UPI002204B28D|nr:hypothetical protein [Sediminibacterium sp. TEGAF015]BDQ11779.1 hypothetical protein TEGAF0_09960 [Sediminibacterium sp. TEGAF015]
MKVLFVLFTLLFWEQTALAQKKVSSKRNSGSQTQKILLDNKLYKELGQKDYQKFKDSIFKFTKDSLSRINKNTVVYFIAKPETLAETWIPSQFVYTNHLGNLVINLNNTQHKRYSLLIYSGMKLMLNLTNIQEDKIILDKSNFYHSGWYQFELYCDGILLEKNKFLL